MSLGKLLVPGLRRGADQTRHYCSTHSFAFINFRLEHADIIELAVPAVEVEAVPHYKLVLRTGPRRTHRTVPKRVDSLHCARAGWGGVGWDGGGSALLSSRAGRGRPLAPVPRLRVPRRY